MHLRCRESTKAAMDYGNDEVLRRCHNHVPVQKFVTLTMGEIIRYG